MNFNSLGLTKLELTTLRRLNTPIKIQNFIDDIPTNFEQSGETNKSPRRTLRENKAHCLEGALVAALAARWKFDDGVRAACRLFRTNVLNSS